MLGRYSCDFVAVVQVMMRAISDNCLLDASSRVGGGNITSTECKNPKPETLSSLNSKTETQNPQFQNSKP
jgi:hypothetical protein